jgi:hypothetical protein
MKNSRIQPSIVRLRAGSPDAGEGHAGYRPGGGGGRGRAEHGGARVETKDGMISPIRTSAAEAPRR